MTKIVIVSKLGKVTNKNVKNFSIQTIYKQCNLKKETKSFKHRHTWKTNNSSYVSIWAKDSGRAGSENKYELPRPLDEVLYFNNLVIVGHSEKDIDDSNCIDLSIEMWNNLYEKLMGGSESLGDDDSYSDDEVIPDELKTTAKENRSRAMTLLKQMAPH